MAIRYDPVFQKEIERVVKNFNAKITRLENKGNELLPEREYVRELKNQYTSRRELKRKLNQLRKFSEQGIEDIVKTSEGTKISKYDIAILKQEKARAIRRTKREIERLEPKMGKYHVLKRSPLDLEKSRLKLLQKPVQNLNAQQLRALRKNIIRVMDYDRKSEQFQSNFFKIIYDEAGFSGVPEYILDNISSSFAKLTSKQLTQLVKDDPSIKAILNYYPNNIGYTSQSRMRDILISLNDRLPEILADYLQA